MSETYLIQVVVGFNPDGTTTTSSFLYLHGGQPAPPKLQVQVGDHIGWVVVVNSQFSRATPHYKLSFTSKAGGPPNSSFFGVDNLAVPGGTSDFLQVRSIQESVKWSLSVEGLGVVLDPDIQSGNDEQAALALQAEVIAGTAPPTYTVTWNIAGKSATWQYGDSGPAYQFPMNISFGDCIAFVTVGASAPYVVFDLNRGTTVWASPSSFLSSAASALSPMTVLDDQDSGKDFWFFFQATGIGPSPEFNMHVV